MLRLQIGGLETRGEPAGRRAACGTDNKHLTNKQIQQLTLFGKIYSSIENTFVTTTFDYS